MLKGKMKQCVLSGQGGTHEPVRRALTRCLPSSRCELLNVVCASQAGTVTRTSEVSEAVVCAFKSQIGRTHTDPLHVGSYPLCVSVEYNVINHQWYNG